MERLTHEADFGLEEWDQTLYTVKSDPGGAYNILDIANHEGEREFNEILKNISLRLKQYEDTGLTPEQIINLQEESRWIPVEERLPNNNENVLVTTDMGLIASGYVAHGEWITDDAPDYPIAWRPFPDPYQPEKES